MTQFNDVLDAGPALVVALLIVVSNGDDYDRSVSLNHLWPEPPGDPEGSFG